MNIDRALEKLTEGKCSKCKIAGGLPLDKSGLCPDCQKTINYGKSKDCDDCSGSSCKTKKGCIAKFKEEIDLTESRPISTIAREVKKDWGAKVNYAARPYLDAMYSLDSINDKYYDDDARSVVAYFLSNASTWKGEKAKEIKAELKALLKQK